MFAKNIRNVLILNKKKIKNFDRMKALLRIIVKIK